MNFITKKTVTDSKMLGRMITRLSHEIIEKCKGIDNLAIVGIRTRGEYIAKRLAEEIENIEKTEVPVGILDVVMYRDDFRSKNKLPKLKVTDIPFDVDNKKLILVDDVIYTGRTVRAALDALTDLGRPASIKLAVLIDRGHREMPIMPNFVGKEFKTAPEEEIRVKVKEIDDKDEILLVEAKK
ncbi:MAG: bifunctional pyr operon transcriptional regulator/uracil phosphoribosyltransferase PyrR [Candidatus Marinimicrobia bacterium]|nr:bifunctional pyr operon transcriptional regulator/uracil phosphoribosyltransferase PyrR [Candidatus Neomarinimicrobiota bacterium]